MAQGCADGIQQNTPAPVSAAQSMGDQVSQAAQSALGCHPIADHASGLYASIRPGNGIRTLEGRSARPATPDRPWTARRSPAPGVLLDASAQPCAMSEPAWVNGALALSAADTAP